jgi:hypothetical protein
MSRFTQSNCSYQQVECCLSPPQLKKMKLSFKFSEPVIIEFTRAQVKHTVDTPKSDPGHNFCLHLTTRQVSDFDKCYELDSGVQLAFSNAQVKSMRSVEHNLISAHPDTVERKCLSSRAYAPATKKIPVEEHVEQPSEVIEPPAPSEQDVGLRQSVQLEKPVISQSKPARIVKKKVQH